MEGRFEAAIGTIISITYFRNSRSTSTSHSESLVIKIIIYLLTNLFLVNCAMLLCNVPRVDVDCLIDCDNCVISDSSAGLIAYFESEIDAYENGHCQKREEQTT